MSTEQPQHAATVDIDDEEEETKQLPADKIREQRQLKAISTIAVGLSSDEASTAELTADDNLLIQAKLFTLMEQHEAAKKVERHNKLMQLKISSEATELIANEFQIAKADADMLLRENAGDIEKVMYKCITDFPQLYVYRNPQKVLGP